MATRTGAPYTHFEATLCDEDHGGCGQLLTQNWWTEDGAQPDQFPPPPDKRCPNCERAPLAHVGVTTADNVAEAEVDMADYHGGTVSNSAEHA